MLYEIKIYNNIIDTPTDPPEAGPNDLEIK